MIERIAIYDFQTHHRRVVEFDPAVTILYGPSDIGKSSILRAIKWVCLNQPRGKEMVGKWGTAPYALVKLTVDGRTVSRKIGPDENAYRLDRGPVLRAMKTGVPAGIAQHLNVADVNFQGQHDGPFWFMLPPPEVSRRLNAIINLGDIDRVLANAAAGVRRAKTLYEAAGGRLAAARTARKRTAWSVRAGAMLDELDRTEDAKRATENRAENLRSTITAAEDADRRYCRARDAADRMAGVVATAGAALRAGERTERLRRYVRELSRPVPAVPDLGPLERVRAALAKSAERVRALQSLCLWVAELEHETCEAESGLTAIEKRLGKIRTCPLCGRPVRSPSRLRAAISICPYEHPRAEQNRTGLDYKNDTSISSVF